MKQRRRRSAKESVKEYIIDLMSKPYSDALASKMQALDNICQSMGWDDLEKRIAYWRFNLEEKWREK